MLYKCQLLPSDIIIAIIIVNIMMYGQYELFSWLSVLMNINTSSFIHSTHIYWVSVTYARGGVLSRAHGGWHLIEAQSVCWME